MKQSKSKGCVAGLLAGKGGTGDLDPRQHIADCQSGQVA